MIDWESLYPDTVRGLERICVDVCGHESLAEEMGWPAVHSVAQQIRAERNAASVVIGHVDRSVTLIEIRMAGLSPIAYRAAIANLRDQATLAVVLHRATGVRQVLAVPHPVPISIMLICELAGVDSIPLLKPAKYRRLLTEAEALA